MPVRLPELPIFDSSPLHSAQMSPQAASAPARALGEVAQGIADLGHAFASHAEEVQARENATLELETRSGWRREAGELEIALQQEPDLAKRRQRMEEFLRNKEGELDTLGLPPAVNDRLRPQFSQFAEELILGTNRDIATESTRRAGIAFKTDVDEASRTGNRTAYEQSKETARDAGILDPESERRLDLSFDAELQAREALADIDADPWGASQVLHSPDAASTYPRLSPDQFESLRRQAEGKANAYKADFWNRVLNNAMNEAPERAVISKTDLGALAEQGLIDADQRASYLRAWHGDTEPAFDPVAYSQAFGAVASYMPQDDPTGAGLANLRTELATLPLPKAHLRELSERLDERLKPEPKKGSHRLASDWAKVTQAKFDNGAFGEWYTYKDHDDDPRTMDRKVINPGEFATALATQRRFTDAWDAYLRNAPENLEAATAQKTYDELFESIVIDDDDGPEASGVIPPAPPAGDLAPDVDKALGVPVAPSPAAETGKETSALRTFGGIPIVPAGSYFRNAVPTVFGSNRDPNDNGLSAFGGTTGTGGREGVAIPEKILQAYFPGRSKDWIGDNARVVVKTADGRQGVFRVADLGTAEWVWKKNGRPTLDLTEGAARQLGGMPLYKDGKLSGVGGLGPLSFAVTAPGGGLAADLRGITLEQAQDAWWKQANPTSTEQILAGLAATRSAWQEANVPLDDNPPGATPIREPKGAQPAAVPRGPGAVDASLLPEFEEDADQLPE